MENVSKALEIAAGTLLAIMILSLTVWVFSNISSWPEDEETIESSEQLAKFNLEYEVFDKRKMYGVDVISCLNKAQSNNDKYVNGGGFLSGNKYGEDYYIQIRIKLKKDLNESLSVYYYDKDDQKIKEKWTEKTGEDYPTMREAGFKVDGYTKFTNDTLISKTINQDLTGTLSNGINCLELNVYNDLCVLSNPNTETALQQLLKYSTDYKQTSTNRANDASLEVWTSATWTTALYDFKTKMFKCDYINYSSKTGRVNEIAFSEV